MPEQSSKKPVLFARKDLITQNYMHFRQAFSSYPDFGFPIFQGKVTLKSTKRSSRTAISLADKAELEVEIQGLKEEHSRIPSKLLDRKSSAELFRRTSSCQLKAGLRSKIMYNNVHRQCLECPLNYHNINYLTRNSEWMNEREMHSLLSITPPWNYLKGYLTF